MDAWIKSLKTLAVDPASNYQALGVAIAIVVVFVTIAVLALIIGALSVPGKGTRGAAEPVKPRVSAKKPATRKPALGCVGFLIWILLVFLGLLASAGVWYRITQTPEYCGRSCHQMADASSLWASSAHSEIPCVQCHEERGWRNVTTNAITRIDHIYAAMTNGRTRTRPVPARRCLACHAGLIDAKLTARNGEPFIHRMDAAADFANCESCHGNQGHEPR